MSGLWQTLIANLAVVALFISGWAHAQHWLHNSPGIVRTLAFPVTMGAAAIASILLSIQVESGVFFDLRSSLIALAGFFGGPLVALVTAGMAVGYRLTMGGLGVWSGTASILLSASVGTLGYFAWRERLRPVQGVVVLGLCTAAITAATMLLLPASAAREALSHFAPPVAFLTLVATIIGGAVISQTFRLAEERTLLRAAFSQAPDFHYVKGLKSQFVAVNEAVATHNGFAMPEDMIGLTDFDITEAERAKRLVADEQAALATGTPIIDSEEAIADDVGDERWFSTSKVPLYDRDRRRIGLAGVTRDITARRRLEEELRSSRNRLSYAMAEMGDGLAMFAQDGSLLFCNERYRRAFPLTQDVRRPGMHIKDILRAVVQTREQKGIPEDDAEGWIDQISAGLHTLSEQEVELFDGRWLHIKSRPTSDGSAIVVASDVTTIKEAEGALLELTKQLKLLASTDAMTGLLNRRTFDQTLEMELARSARDRTSLALLMIDVDRFKAYNDNYGHPSGDDCLRAVARCLRDTLKRPADSACRYGGEEFSAILPNTDEDGAYFIATQFRTALRGLALPHSGSEKGIVTASIGLALAEPQDRPDISADLVSRADSALYLAKEAGRDRVMGWRRRSPLAADGSGHRLRVIVSRDAE